MLALMRRFRFPATVQPLSWNVRLIFALLSCGLGWSQTVRDDFSTYAPESDASPAWDPQAAGWTVVDGACHGEEGASVWRAVPWAASVRYARDVTMLEYLNGDWLTAGIGLQIDERNYWAVNLVTAPERDQRKHSTEMQEMVQGVWPAQMQASNRLEELPSHGAGLNWQLGRTVGVGSGCFHRHAPHF